VPLGTPLLAGPGAIVATMVFVSQAHGWAQYLAIAAGIVTVHVILWATLRFSLTVHRFLRDSGVTLLSKIAGVLLSAIAVQLVADAVFAFVRQGR
jgi:multiple antibiotic resistance protein